MLGHEGPVPQASPHGGEAPQAPRACSRDDPPPNRRHTMNPCAAIAQCLEAKAERSDEKSRSRLWRTVNHQVRGQDQRQRSQTYRDLVSALGVEQEALANGASKRKAKRAAAAAFKAALEGKS